MTTLTERLLRNRPQHWRFPYEKRTLASWFQDFPANPPEFPDVKAQYEALFPGPSARTRQRDFETLSKAGYTVTYHPAWKAYVIRDFIEDEFDDPWAGL